MNKIENYKLPPGRSLGLKVVYPDGRPELWFLEDFRWSLELGGTTEALEWESSQHWDGGLHVWEWAQGFLGISGLWRDRDPEGVWLAVEYDTSSAVVRGRRTKVPKYRIIAFGGDKKEVVSFIKDHTPEEKRGLFLFEERTVEEGDVEVGDGGIAIVRGKGTAKAGPYGTAFAGNGGTAIAGGWGRAEAGEGGTAMLWLEGTAKAGAGGKLISLYHSREYLIGENGVKPDTFYTFDVSGNPVEAV